LSPFGTTCPIPADGPPHGDHSQDEKGEDEDAEHRKERRIGGERPGDGGG
jgi:hypothetical protein